MSDLNCPACDYGLREVCRCGEADLSRRLQERDELLEAAQREIVALQEAQARDAAALVELRAKLAVAIEIADCFCESMEARLHREHVKRNCVCRACKGHEALQKIRGGA